MTGLRLPTPAQRALLRAALAPGAAGSTAWAELRPSLDLDRLDAPSLRLLPLLSWNLSRLGVADSLRPRLRGVHRYSWTHSQRQLRFLARVLEGLHAARVDTLLLKDGALAQYYPSIGLRPIGSVDVLVPEEQAGRASELLARSGFAPDWLPPDAARPPDAIRRQGTQRFLSPRGEAIALHRRVPWKYAAPGLDADLWQHSVPLSLGPVSTRALCPSDQLLDVCLQGAQWSEAPDFDWLADAVFLLGAPGAGVDWPRIVDLARRLGVVLPLRDGLAIARSELAAPVPPAVLTALDRAPVPRWQRVEHTLRVRRPTLLSRLWLHAFHHWRQERHAGPLRAAWGFPRYLARTLERAGMDRVSWSLLRARGRRARRLPAGVPGTIPAPGSEKLAERDATMAMHAP